MDLLSYSGFIFDLDGTLIDSMGVWNRVDRLFLEKRGIPFSPDYPRAIRSKTYEQAALYTKERYGLAQSIPEIIGEWNAMVRGEYIYKIELKPGAAAFLRFLHESGKKIALATASAAELYAPVLRRGGIYGFFDAFTTLSEVRRGKGFPDIYLLAARRLGLEPHRCIVFEDILEGIRGAKSGGMAAVGVADASAAHEAKAIAGLADLFIEDFTRLLPKEKI